MKAIVIEQYGSAEQLIEKEMPVPELGAHQVLVEMYATSINPVDWKMREGYLKEMLSYDFPIILGWDAAGIVKETGEGVTSFQKGDRVFARPVTSPKGTYAEYTAIDENQLAKIPNFITFEEAASIPLVGETAWHALVDIAQVKSGDKVLIHAGAGGVGSLAIQIAKSFGATVAATGSAKNQEFLESLGTDIFVDYQNTNFEEVLNDYDIVLDTIGGETQTKSFNVLKAGGILVSITTPPDEQLAKEKDVRVGYFFLEPEGRMLKELAQLLEKDQLTAIVGEVFPFTEEGIRQAHELSATHHAQGKLVIRIRE